MISYSEAEQDFLYSKLNNNTKPSEEVCKALLAHKRFENVLQQATEENVKSVSFCSEGNGKMSIIFNPVFTGNYSTKLLVDLGDGEKIDVWFDRN